MKNLIKTRIILYSAILLAVFAVVVIAVLYLGLDSVSSLGQLILLVTLSVIICFAIVLALGYVINKAFAKKALMPLEIIDQKISKVLGENSQEIMLTKYDEINSILMGIDAISQRHNKNLAEYQAEKEKLKFIIENLNQGIIGLSGSKEVILCNRAARDFFNFWADLPVYVNKIRAGNKFYEMVIKSLQQNQPITFELEKGAKILEVRFIPKKPKKVSLIVVIEDVTAVKKLAREKQAFFENAGHELKTPLSSILGYSELLVNSNQHNPNFAMTINKEAKKMDALLQDMLKISSLESSKNHTKESSINLKPIIEDVLVSYIPFAEKKEIQLTQDLVDCRILAQADKMSELISNLVDNAIKYTNKGGKVEVVLKCEKDFALFSVKDNGIGIPQQYQSRIFERFFRVDSGRSKTEGGTGLGLSIVKHISSHYGGQILLQSNEGVGSTFSVKLPLEKSSRL